MLDQRHGAVGVDLRTTPTWIEFFEDSGGLHGDAYDAALRRGRLVCVGQAGRWSGGGTTSGAAAAAESARSEAIGVGDGAARPATSDDDVSCFDSDCISLISDLKIRIDLPRERAASGSFLEPKSRTSTAMTIIQCHGCRPPNLVTSRRRAQSTWPLRRRSAPQRPIREPAGPATAVRAPAPQ